MKSTEELKARAEDIRKKLDVRVLKPGSSELMDVLKQAAMVDAAKKQAPIRQRQAG